MRILYSILFLMSVLVASSESSRADPLPPATPVTALSLSDIIRRAESFSPDLKAAEASESAAHQGVRISQSLYYPTLDLTAVDSTGFPAAANAPTGFNGLMDSPFRSGLSGGAYTTFSFFDLTREYGVKSAHSNLAASEETTKVRRLETDLKAMNLYLDAVLDLSQRETWKNIQSEIDRLYSVVKKFVKNGQYSEVTGWLLKNKNEQALRRQEDFHLAYRAALKRIAILIGASEGSVEVAGLPTLEATVGELAHNRLAESPLVTEPKVQTQASQAFAAEQSAQNWPRILGIASAGAMQDTRLVPKQDYAAWIGLTLPVFEGFRISAEEARAQAMADRSADLAKQAELELADTDTRFDQETAAHRTDIQHYQLEREYALKALKLAEHRYTTFVGDLADVRDSLVDFETAESGLNVAQIELYRSQLSRAIVDGGYLGQ